MRKLLSAALLCGLAACSDTPSATEATPQIAPQSASLSQSPSTLVPGRYIVQFRTSSSTSQQDAALVSQTYGGTVERVYGAALNGAVMQLSDKAVAALRKDARVLSVEQDQVFSVETIQNNPPSWGLDRIDQRALPLAQAYNYSVSGSGVNAYIIDTGINFAQADFGGRAVTGYDAITAGGTGQDCNGHGTHTAGTVGSTTYGVAKSVRLYAVRVMDCVGNGTTSTVLAGVDWVTRNAIRPAVVNMSLGGGLSMVLNNAVENSIASGISYVVSAGNNTTSACNQSPAAAPSVISVGATGTSDEFAYFSNYGSCVHISAPGMYITSLWTGASGSTTTISGTSMASPHVAGVAALYLQTNPGATPAQVRNSLVNNATQGIITSLPAATPNRLLYAGFIAGGPAPVAPVAAFSSACTALTCAFDGSATTAQTSATYAWTFGDGSTGSGKTASRTYAAGGTYSVTLTVADANGSNSKTIATVVTAPVNQSPTAAISAPSAGSVVQGTSVTFTGTANDPEDGALSGTSLVWTSSIDGQLGTGASFAKSNLSAGSHTITLTAKDSKSAAANATRAITVTVPVNQAPSATISTPSNNAVAAPGTSVTFTGNGSDAEDGTLGGASLVWTSSRDGQIGTGTSFAKANLSTGTHAITLTARDSKGATGVATRTLTIANATNSAPSVSITSPTNFSSIGQGVALNFVGAGSDPDDGTLSGASLIWTSSRDGQIGTGSSFTKSDLSLGKHTITLTGKDAQGVTATATRTISIVTNMPPTPRYTSSCTSRVCSLDASTSTDDGAILEFSWSFGDGTSNTTSTTPTTTHTFAAAGNYTITLTVKDNKGSIQGITRMLTVP